MTHNIQYLGNVEKFFFCLFIAVKACWLIFFLAKNCFMSLKWQKSVPFGTRSAVSWRYCYQLDAAWLTCLPNDYLDIHQQNDGYQSAFISCFSSKCWTQSIPNQSLSYCPSVGKETMNQARSLEFIIVKSLDLRIKLTVGIAELRKKWKKTIKGSDKGSLYQDKKRKDCFSK